MSFKLSPLILLAMSIVIPACSAPKDVNSNETIYSGSFAILDNQTREILLNCDVDQKEFNRLLVLPQDKFDQDFKGGWRAISYKTDCQNAAAEIIKAYILYSEPFPPKNISILRWHAGQTKASAGKYDEAISLFKGTYKSDNQHGEAWNLYVDSTIAFLQNDLSKLKKAHDSLASLSVTEAEKESRRKFLKDNPNITMPEGFVDKPSNLAPVESLLKCFGQPYFEAYGSCNK